MNFSRTFRLKERRVRLRRFGWNGKMPSIGLILPNPTAATGFTAAPQTNALGQFHERFRNRCPDQRDQRTAPEASSSGASLF